MRIAVIVHVFYPGLWPELARHIRNFAPCDPDIFATIPETDGGGLEGAVRRDFPEADVKRLPNRGFDVGPFVETVERIDLDAYDLVVKLHTKRNRFGFVNFMPLFGGQWRRRLFAFCRTRRDVDRCLAVFAADPSVGMIGHGALIVRPCDEMVPNPPPDDPNDRRSFVAGTMFIARAALFRSLRGRIAFADFEPTDRAQTASLAHAWERELGYLVSQGGQRIAAHPSASRLAGLFRAIGKRRPLRLKQGQHGFPEPLN